MKSFTDDLFAMIKKEADEVISGTNKTKLSIYSCHDTSVMRILESGCWCVAILTVLTPFLPCDVPPYAANICIEYWKNQFDNSFDVALRYNGEYQPIFIEHYVESIVGLRKEVITRSFGTRISARLYQFRSIYWMWWERRIMFLTMRNNSQIHCRIPVCWMWGGYWLSMGKILNKKGPRQNPKSRMILQ